MVVATSGGVHWACAFSRTVQLTAQLGNVLVAAVGTKVCAVTAS